MDEADRCDDIVLMRDGAILAAEPPASCCWPDRRRRRRAGLPASGDWGRVSPRVVLATGRRVLPQLRGDPRTLALLLLVPCVLLRR